MVVSRLLFNDKLEQLEQKINRYQELLSSGFKRLQFPAEIEQDYIWHSNVNFIKTSQGLLSFGILLYLAFGFSDFFLGQDQANTLWVIRVFVSTALFTGILLIFKRRFVLWVVKAASLGMIVIGCSVIVFMWLLDEPYGYAYHLGIVPWQVFVLIVLRSYLRAIMICSLSVFIIYIIFSYNQEIKPFSPEIDGLMDLLRPLYILFWGGLVIMGIYLGYFMEHSARVDYVKNRLLALDAERLTLLSEELRLLSTTDGLTGLANRRHFENCFESEWRRALRTKDSLCLIMIDIDYFKNYNDHYGHQAGDRCLKEVSELLKSFAQRSGELVARYGGEEFVILLPRMTLVAAHRIAENMCRQVEELNIEHAASILNKVTVSIGIAATIPSLEADSDSLLKESDRALYQAKANGRNCVVSS